MYTLIFLILETIRQIKVKELENPAADVIPMWVLRQFTDQNCQVKYNMYNYNIPNSIIHIIFND